jgi:hypothetical protein
MASVVQVADALHTDGAVVSAADGRLSQASVWSRTGAGLTVRTGVAWSGSPNLITSTATTAPSMTVQVAALHFVGSKAYGEGIYVGTSPSVVTLDIGAAPGGGTSRLDVVYAMQRDASSTAAPDGSTQAEVGVIAGTAAAFPAKPAIPTGAVEVGTVLVAAGVTATSNAGCTITTTCQWTVPNGSAVPVRSDTERATVAQFPGAHVFRLDFGYTERSNGTTWTPTVEVWQGNESPSVGSVPPARKAKIRYTGSVSVVTTSGGGFGITNTASTGFAAGFPGLPNGAVSYSLIAGDTFSGLATVDTILASSSLSVIFGIARDSTGAVIASRSVRINWVAEGW